MVELVQFPRGQELPNYSPFCLKVEAFLVFHGIVYKVHEVLSPAHSRTGLLPFIRHDGKEIADSALILTYLDQQFGINMDHMLSETEKAISRAVIAMVEERLARVLVTSRWLEPHNLRVLGEKLLPGIPAWLRQIPLAFLQRRVRRSLLGHGLLRYPMAQIYEFGVSDIRALAKLLGAKEYIHGTCLTTVDFSVFAVLANILYPPFMSPLRTELQSQQNLVQYCSRVQDRLQMSF